MRSLWSKGSSTNPNAAGDIEEEVDEDEEFANVAAAIEEEMENGAATEQGQEQTDNAVVEEMGDDQGQEHSDSDNVVADEMEGVEGIITEFNPDHIITDPDASLGIVSFLTLQGEPFHGHDESPTSLN